MTGLSSSSWLNATLVANLVANLAEDYDLYPDGLLPIPAKKLADLLVLSAF